jgi:S-DNA-T family DNA segregation ATPase FtsK/SpoIIIE
LAGVPSTVLEWVERFRAERQSAADARRKRRREEEAERTRSVEPAAPIPKVISRGSEPVVEAARTTAAPVALRPARPGKEVEAAGVPAKVGVTVKEAPSRVGAGTQGYELPPLDLISAPEVSQQDVKEDEVMDASRTLQEALAHFGVRGRVGEVHPGPVITRYDFEPAAGVKVNQILSRQDDISLALRCQGIRRVAPIPGKAAVGIEVPNRSPQVVYLKELLSRPEFRDSDAKLTLGIGKTVAGDPYFADLASMPHLLIAGATGSGKSVCVNSIIVSLLYRLTGDELKLLLIDPKRLELSGYNGIPHLLLPVVTDHKKAAGALRWVVHEMDRRYKSLAAAGARDIASFNARLEEERLAGGDSGLVVDLSESAGPAGSPGLRDGAESGLVGESGAGKLPYLVVIIDELADLMVALPAEIEEPVTRLAQMARAVGIHLILATQRPSVDVITGLIKANFPCRIAFQVAAKVDSRTILDTNGAECLMGHGDMLFLSGGSPQPVRIHGPYVSPEETVRVTEFLRKQVSSEEEVGAEVEIEDKSWDDSAADEEIFKEAAKLVVLHQQGSTSLLQRRLRIGYSRAARIVDMLEQRGIVGPFKGSKAREVLVDEQYLKENRLI